LADQSKPPYFDRDSLPLSQLYRDIGRTPKRPFMILSTLLESSLGDLIAKIVFLSTLKEQFDHARLILRYRDVRPYSNDVVSLSPNIDHATAIKGERPKWLAERFPDMRPWLPLGRWTLGARKLQDAFYDLVVIESMMDIRMLHGLNQPSILRIPPDREESLGQQLIGSGLDPNRWYATVHYRDGTYGPKRNKGPLRTSSPDSYRKLVNYIIDELGGQVVQLGHPEMEPLSSRPGFVDLSRFADGFMLQAYAVRHSRFLIAGPSGPAALGLAFQVPTARVDATDGHGGWGDVDQVILTHEVTTPDGRVLSNRALYEAGLLEYVVLTRKIRDGENYRVRKNSGEELASVARFLFDRTSDMRGWRPAYQRPATKRPNHLIWPPQTVENLRFFGE
jgi:putative glycosyltransferase (TIGR04372 family)